MCIAPMYRQATPPVPAAPPARTPVPAPPPLTERAPAPPAAGTATDFGSDGLAPLLSASVLARRKKTTALITLAESAKANLKASLGAKTATECKKKLEKRFPKGPLFTASDLLEIQTLETTNDGRKWLEEVGIGSWTEANDYLKAGDYKQWLKQLPGKRLLIATIAWKKKIGASEDNPPPSYTLGRAMAIQTGDHTGALDDQAKQQAEKERDDHIRNAFVNTLMPVGPKELLEVQLKAPNNANEIIAHNAEAQQILARILLLLQVGLQVYDPKTAQHIDYKTGDVVRALAHGGRVNIRIPALSGDNKQDSAYALTDWIGITDKGKAVGSVKERGFGTHHMNIGENKHGPGTGSFVEEGGKGASMSNKTSKGNKLFGLDLAAGGLGKTDFNGDVILPDGGHGHMFIGFTKPTKKKDGALQIGIETTGPGADSLVGYKHDWNSTEATANPESSLYGHKMQKVGGGKLKHNQRLVDLNKLQADEGKKWTEYLDELGTALDDALANMAGQERPVYELVAGQRT
jgi:hypothetical protein